MDAILLSGVYRRGRDYGRFRSLKFKGFESKKIDSVCKYVWRCDGNGNGIKLAIWTSKVKSQLFASFQKGRANEKQIYVEPRTSALNMTLPAARAPVAID